MTPARLEVLVDMDDYAAEQASKNSGKHRRATVSNNPAADLAALASM